MTSRGSEKSFCGSFSRKGLQDDLAGIDIVDGAQDDVCASRPSVARRHAAGGSLRPRKRATPALKTPMTSKSSREGRTCSGRMIGFSDAR